MTWLAPDGCRYLVSIYREPFDQRATIAFQGDDGWLGVTSTVAGRDIPDLIITRELCSLLTRAKEL